MTVKSRDGISTQLSTGGSSGEEVERDLVKDIVDSFVHSSEASGIADYDPANGYTVLTSARMQGSTWSVSTDTVVVPEGYTQFLVELKWDDDLLFGDMTVGQSLSGYQYQLDIWDDEESLNSQGDLILNVGDTSVYLESLYLYWNLTEVFGHKIVMASYPFSIRSIRTATESSFDGIGVGNADTSAVYTHPAPKPFIGETLGVDARILDPDGEDITSLVSGGKGMTVTLYGK